MHDAIRVLAGDCTVEYDDAGDGREERGAVVALVKPDGTVLVHDRRGYRPAAWLTRAENLAVGRGEAGPVIEASDGARSLRVVCHAEYGQADYAASDLGNAVGDCPDCGGTLVDGPGRVSCLECDADYRVPRDATVLGTRCACGLPRMRVERGAEIELCVDRGCGSLDDAVRDRFDREWSCPDCGGDLRVLRRGGLIAGCERYPECEVGYSVPAGVVDGDCACGLPIFETPSGRRCLDSTCSGA